MVYNLTHFAIGFLWSGLAASLATTADFVGEEVVNGVKTLHYTSDDASWEKSIEAEFGRAHLDRQGRLSGEIRIHCRKGG